MRIPVVMSWSGGKDSARASHELLRSAYYEVVELMATISEEYRAISYHGVREELLDVQAAAIGIPLAKSICPRELPAAARFMERVMTADRGREVRTVAFGDQFLQDLRARAHRSLTHKARAAVTPNGGDEDVAWSKNRAGGLVQTNRGRGSRS